MSTSTAAAAAADAYPRELRLLVAGEWVAAEGRETVPVVNPADAAELGRLPVAAEADVDAAVVGAAAAWPAWRALGPDGRGAILRGAAALLRERAEPIATVATLEQGKTRGELLQEVQMAAAVLDWAAEEGRRAYGRVLAQRAPGTRVSVVREPVGPVAALTPWNFPLAGPARKLGPALAAGCPVVLKPAEETPASALEIARALVDAGLPAGVLSVVCGRPAEISARLLAAPEIRKLNFTGSTAVGSRLLALAAGNVARTTMELGGHAPVIVLDDADLATTIAHSVFLKYRNAGQICVSPTRFYVHEAVYDRFVEGFAAGARAVVVGNGLDEGTQMGPLAHARRVEAVTALVDDARAAGAELVAGGGAMSDRTGFFFEPTVLAGVPDRARAMNEEPFGPVALIAPVADLDEAVERANRLPYGLAAYAFTGAARSARQLADRLEAGIVGVNSYAVWAPDAPSGGVKHSGHGSEDGSEGLAGHLVTKAIYEA